MLVEKAWPNIVPRFTRRVGFGLVVGQGNTSITLLPGSRETEICFYKTKSFISFFVMITLTCFHLDTP